jgi:hypothetical protein
VLVLPKQLGYMMMRPSCLAHTLLMLRVIGPHESAQQPPSMAQRHICWPAHELHQPIILTGLNLAHRSVMSLQMHACIQWRCLRLKPMPLWDHAVPVSVAVLLTSDDP